jgi:hypothetical protein
MQRDIPPRALCLVSSGRGNLVDGTRVGNVLADIRCMAVVRLLGNVLARKGVGGRGAATFVVVVLSCFCTLLDIAAA